MDTHRHFKQPGHVEPCVSPPAAVIYSDGFVPYGCHNILCAVLAGLRRPTSNFEQPLLLLFRYSSLQSRKRHKSLWVWGRSTRLNIPAQNSTATSILTYLNCDY